VKATADEIAKLVTEIRAKHVLGKRAFGQSSKTMRDACLDCIVLWPCDAIRAADALEACGKDARAKQREAFRRGFRQALPDWVGEVIPPSEYLEPILDAARKGAKSE
jgi:hypothetical protein